MSEAREYEPGSYQPDWHHNWMKKDNNRPRCLMDMRLNARYMVAVIMVHQLKHLPQANYVWGAWEYWGKEVVEMESAENRMNMYKAVQWCYENRDAIFSHRAWRDINKATGGGYIVNPYRSDKVNDTDWTWYTEEEISLLKREKKHRKKLEKAKLKRRNIRYF